MSWLDSCWMTFSRSSWSSSSLCNLSSSFWWAWKRVARRNRSQDCAVLPTLPRSFPNAINIKHPNYCNFVSNDIKRFQLVKSIHQFHEWQRKRRVDSARRMLAFRSLNTVFISSYIGIFNPETAPILDIVSLPQSKRLSSSVACCAFISWVDSCWMTFSLSSWSSTSFCKRSSSSWWACGACTSCNVTHK